MNLNFDLKPNPYYLGLIILALVLIYLISTSPVKEGWYEWVSDFWNKTNLTGFDEYSHGREHGAPYQNNCLTCTPFGFDSPAFHYFQNYERDFKKQYKDCTKYQCSTPKQNELTAAPVKDHANRSAKTDAHSISTSYYHDPAAYCKRHPDHYPCPNFWIKNSELVGAKRAATKPSMMIPSMKKGIEPQARTYCKNGNVNELAECDVNDNQRMLILYPDTEDHGLC